jgi:uncharacterized NAD(P)/FAD-binding protein YdhS
MKKLAIIGSGPSAIGFISGILQAINDSKIINDDDEYEDLRDNLEPVPKLFASDRRLFCTDDEFSPDTLLSEKISSRSDVSKEPRDEVKSLSSPCVVLEQALEVHIFDKSSVLGAGLPYDYSIADPEHSLNVQAVSGAIPSDDFLKWIKKNKDEIEKIFKEIFIKRKEEKFMQRVKSILGGDFDDQKVVEYKTQFADLDGNITGHYDKIWMSFQNRLLFAVDGGKIEDGKRFYPRTLYGYYSVGIFDEKIKELEKVAKVVLHSSSEVLSITKQSEILSLTFEEKGERKEEEFSNYFVATGMREYIKKSDLGDGYIDDIWEKSDGENIVKKAITRLIDAGQKEIKIAIQGAGLSTIDMLKTIFHDGILEEKNGVLTFTPDAGGDVKISVDILSRSGLLPQVRGKFDETENQNRCYKTHIDGMNRAISGKISEKPNIRLYEVVGIFIRALIDIYEDPLVPNAEGQNYDASKKAAIEFLDFIEKNKAEKNINELMIKKFMEMRNQDEFLELESSLDRACLRLEPTEVPYQNLLLNLSSKYKEKLTDDDEKFLKSCGRIMQVYLTPMPPQSARDLLAMHRSGVLHSVYLGGDSSPKLCDDGKIKFIDKGGEEKKYDLALNCTGERLNVEESQSPLYQSIRAAKADNVDVKSGIKEGEDFPKIFIQKTVGGIASATRVSKAAAKIFAEGFIK